MAIQTQQMAASLPRFASLLKLADAKGSSAWQVVHWRETSPAEVAPSDVIPLAEILIGGQRQPNRFDNRTQALRLSKAHVRESHPDATEAGHWGVWQWRENGATCYQTVMPIRSVKRSEQPNAVRETRTAVYSPVVRVSEESSRRLREIAAARETTMQSVLDCAIKDYYRQWFFDCADDAYRSLRDDSGEWAHEASEREAWDAVLLDGLESDDVWRPSAQATRGPE
jgi:predicted transcriptional regulator